MTNPRTTGRFRRIIRTEIDSGDRSAAIDDVATLNAG